MKFLHILTELYCEPWAIMPRVHEQICDIVKSHIDGTAHDGRIKAFVVENEPTKPDNFQVVDGNIAVIPIVGVIGKRISSLEKSSGITDIDEISKMVTDAVNDETIEGIMYDINSPGGMIAGVPEAAKIMSNASRVKPSVAYVDQLMASAALWLGVSARSIYASESAKIGSVGTYVAFLDSSKKFDTDGMKAVIIKSGKFKGMGMEGTSLTDEETALLQEMVDKTRAWFVAHILAHRSVPDSAMQGQAFFADDARRVGMVDMVGTQQDAVNELKAMIKLEG